MRLGQWKKVLSYALALWVIVFITIALLDSLGLTRLPLPANVVLLLVAVLVYWTLATRLHLVSLSGALAVGLIWFAINIVLDYLIIVLGFNGGDPAFFMSRAIWIRYLLLLLVPVVAASRRQNTN